MTMVKAASVEELVPLEVELVTVLVVNRIALKLVLALNALKLMAVTMVSD